MATIGQTEIGGSIEGFRKLIEDYRAANPPARSLSSNVPEAPTFSPLKTSYQPEMNVSDYLQQNYQPEANTIMGRYNQAREGVSEAARYGRELTMSKSGREIEDTYSEGQKSLKGIAEARRGFASNTALIRETTEQTRKRVMDLERNMNELLLQNKYAEASALSELIIKEQTSLTEARSNFLNEYFNVENLRRGTAEFNLDVEKGNRDLQQRGFENQMSVAQEGRLAQGQEFDQSIESAEESRRKLAFRTPEQEANLAILQNLATKFADAGITINDTVDSAAAKVRASPSYNLDRRSAEANIAQSYASVAYTQAQTRKLSQEVTDGGGNAITFTDLNGKQKEAQVSQLTKSVMMGLGSLKDLTPTDKSKVLSEFARIGYNPKQQLAGRMFELLKLWKEIPDQYKGLMAGSIYSTAGIGASLNPYIAKFESARTPLTREIARLYDVGVLSDQDVADYKSAMPSLRDTSYSVAEAKLKGLGTAMGTALGSNQAVGSSNNGGSSGTTSTGLKFQVLP